MGVTEDTQAKFALRGAIIKTDSSPFCGRKKPQNTTNQTTTKKYSLGSCSVLHNTKLKVNISNSEAANTAKC